MTPQDRWPSLVDYQGPVRYASRTLKDVRLHTMSVEMDAERHRPLVSSGGFGTVFRFAGGRSRALALKVFIRTQPERQRRYELISKALEADPVRYLIVPKYEAEGILCNGRWWPTLVMDWVEGRRLDDYISGELAARGEIKNGELCAAWADLVSALDSRRIAHGDLQQGNVLVQADGSLTLVDYDGMFVPGLRPLGLKQSESGLPSYQHPRRPTTPAFFNERLDDFSALVILHALASLTRDRWTRFNKGGDKWLLARTNDLAKPEGSALFRELGASPDAPVRRLTELLIASVKAGLSDVPRFTAVIRDSAIKDVLTASWRPSQAAPRHVAPPRKDVTQKRTDVVPVVRTCVSCRQPLAPGESFCSNCGAAPDGPRASPPLRVVDKRRIKPGSDAVAACTAAEIAAVRMMVEGMSDAEIARHLSISPKIGAELIASAMVKVGVITRKDLVIWAMTQVLTSAAHGSGSRVHPLPPEAAPPPKPPDTPPTPVAPAAESAPKSKGWGWFTIVAIVVVVLSYFSRQASQDSRSVQVSDITAQRGGSVDASRAVPDEASASRSATIPDPPALGPYRTEPVPSPPDSPPPSVSAPVSIAAAVDAVWLDEGVQSGPYRWLVTHCRFHVTSPAPTNVSVTAWLFWSNGAPMMARSAAFSAANGQVATMKWGAAAYTVTSWPDIDLWIPYPELSQGTAFVRVEIRDERATLLAWANSQAFQIF